MNKSIPKLYKVGVFLAVAGFLAVSGHLASASPITELNVIELLNQARMEKGLRILVPNEKLFRVADNKAEDMLKNDYFAHTSPKGITPWFWFEKNSYDYKYAGENLAINFSRAEDQQKAWMESETHRKNILDPNYVEIGVAVKKGIVDGKLTIVTVQEFGRPMAYAETGGSGKTAGAKKDATFLVDNSLPKTELGMIKNFKSQLAGAGKNLNETVVGMKSEKIYSYAETGAALILWAIMIVVNPVIVVWIAVRSAFVLKEKYQKTSAQLKLKINNREEYLKFLEGMGIDSQRARMIYLEQMKLKR